MRRGELCGSRQEAEKRDFEERRKKRLQMWRRGHSKLLNVNYEIFNRKLHHFLHMLCKYSCYFCTQISWLMGRLNAAPLPQFSLLSFN